MRLSPASYECALGTGRAGPGRDYGQSRRSTKSVQDRESATQRRRVKLESRATVDAAGGCGWCGSRIAHGDGRGTLVSPLDHHSADIEELLRAESAR